MEEILTELNNRAKNIFIEKYVSLPEISKQRLQILNLSLNYASVPKPLRKVYCVSTGLIQMGLDLHETVTNQKETHEKNIRKRQLSILTGDYYSSQYYSLLSRNNLTEEVRKLADAVSNINIAKMKLYSADNNFYSIEQAIDLFKIRESNLYVQFLNLFNTDSVKRFWEFIIENMNFLFKLYQEMNIKNFGKHTFSYFLLNHHSNVEERKEINESIYNSDLNTKIKNLMRKYDLQGKIDDTIQNIYEKLENKINGFEDRLIQKELFFTLNQFNNIFHLDKAVEKI